MGLSNTATKPVDVGVKLSTTNVGGVSTVTSPSTFGLVLLVTAGRKGRTSLKALKLVVTVLPLGLFVAARWMTVEPSGAPTLTWKLMSTRLPGEVVVIGTLLSIKMPICPVVEFTLGRRVQLLVKDPSCTSELVTVKTEGS